MSESLANRFCSEFEDGMGALWDAKSDDIPDLMQHMAIFFSGFRPGSDHSDSYSILIDMLASAGKLNNVIFSTLNYECILEIAASQLGRRLDYFSEYSPSNDMLPIWKLHGSCNFLPGGNVRATRAARFRPGAVFNPGIEAVDPARVADYCRGNTALYPSMSIMARGKPVQISPPIIESLQNRWSSAVEKAEVVVVVGVRPYPIDGHIWKPLASTQASVFFVGNEEVFELWVSEFRNGRSSEYIGPRFHEHIHDVVNRF